jgi:putative ABC transport system permease protein
MYYNLALKNLFSRKVRTALTTLAISVGIASLALLLALSEGLKQAIYQNISGGSSLTQITVQPKNDKKGVIRFLPGDASAALTPEALQKIENISYVTAAYPEMIYGNISSIQVNVLGQGFQSDTMIFGVPYEFIEQDLPGQKSSWQNPQSPYPAIISRKILDLYNFTVAPTNSLPNFTEKDISGTKVTILPNQSTFFPSLGTADKFVSVKIEGFSEKTSLLGITLPIDVVRDLNKQRDPNYQEHYLRFFVQVDSAANISAVRDEIEKLGFAASSNLEEVKALENNFKVVTAGLGLISLIILLVSGLMIANTFFAAVAERRHEIGIFRAVGATRADVQKVFLTEAVILGAAGGFAGIIIALVGGFFLNIIALDALPAFTSKPDSIFIHDPLALLYIFAFAVVLSMVFAMIPASKAANLDPLEALTQ